MADPDVSPSNIAETAIREHFVRQAEACDGLGSPFTAKLCRALPKILDHTTQTGRRVLDWPGHAREDALALRLCGGLHALVLSGRDEILAAAYPPNDTNEDVLVEILPGIFRAHDLELVAALGSAPQTNEIARSGMLLPGFLLIARETGLPLALNEIGSSAGLNLMFDRFHYRYENDEFGDPASPVRLAPETRGRPVPSGGALDVVARRGCDIAPIDIDNPADRLRLRSYVWADQAVRLQRLDAAIALAGTTSFSLEKADAALFLRKRLAERRDGETFVLFHSIMWQYLPAATKASITADLEHAGDKVRKTAPIAWLRMEPLTTSDKHATLSLTQWPGGRTRHLARCDYHGRWIEWIG